MDDTENCSTKEGITVRITRLQTNHMTCPMGIAVDGLRFSYQIAEAEGERQTQSRIQLATAPDDTVCVYDTGTVDTVTSPDTGRILTGIDPLAWMLPVPVPPRTRMWWRAWACSDTGDSAWSDWTWFETAKSADEGWQAIPITTPYGQDVHPMFRRRFFVERPVKKARMYCIGLGEYEASLNGKKLGDDVLQPGLHTYDSYLQYQTLELPVKQGCNEVMFMLGDGWYKGRYGLKRLAPHYGDEYVLLAEIHVQYEDGTEDVFGTDERWEVGHSPVTFDGIYDGETVDMRIVPWDEVCQAVPGQLDLNLLTPRISPKLRIQQTLSSMPVEGCPGVFDMQQNMVGWVSFWCDAPKDTIVTLHFAELMRDGKLYRENLRTAACTFTYISDGIPRQVQPHFTFFGFRYVEFDGWQPEADKIEGCVIHSDMEQTGRLITSEPRLNRLIDNILWSQRGNFLDVPTDCPQRDERMGWTGDIQIFSDAALYNMDCTAFLEKFMRDLTNDQKQLDGNVPCVTPMTHYYLAGVAAWGDAVTIVPWQVYLHSGDAAVLRSSFDGMKSWVNWIHAQTDIDGTGDLWTASPQLGDWLALDGNSVYGGTDRGLIATAYYYESSIITAKAAAVLGEHADAEHYAQLAESIKAAFIREYFTPSGRLAVETQTVCAVVSHLGLIPNGAQARVDALLRRKVLDAGVSLETGFVGTPWLLPALTRGGAADLAYELLLREEYPGWLYEVNSGATTVWERWNSIEPDGSMNKDGMNSLNHYAYGSVAAWMFRSMAGIAPAEDAPGFRHIMCRPVPDRRIAAVCAEKATCGGVCRVAWKWFDQYLELAVDVPFGCVMDMQLPDGSAPKRLYTGHYEWSLTVPLPAAKGLDASWRSLLTDERAHAVLERLFPRAIKGVAFQDEMYTLRQLTESPFAELNREEIALLEQEIKKIQ